MLDDFLGLSVTTQQWAIFFGIYEIVVHVFRIEIRTNSMRFSIRASLNVRVGCHRHSVMNGFIMRCEIDRKHRTGSSTLMYTFYVTASIAGVQECALFRQ